MSMTQQTLTVTISFQSYLMNEDKIIREIRNLLPLIPEEDEEGAGFPVLISGVSLLLREEQEALEALGS